MNVLCVRYALIRVLLSVLTCCHASVHRGSTFSTWASRLKTRWTLRRSTRTVRGSLRAIHIYSSNCKMQSLRNAYLTHIPIVLFHLHYNLSGLPVNSVIFCKLVLSDYFVYFLIIKNQKKSDFYKTNYIIVIKSI